VRKRTPLTRSLCNQQNGKGIACGPWSHPQNQKANFVRFPFFAYTVALERR